MDRLIAMNVFRKVVELGSFSAAARHLEMSNASISKYLIYLENHLGAQLLIRTTRRMNLTDAGHTYYEKCGQILEEIDNAETSVNQQYPAPRGLLKVRAPLSLGAAHLGRVISTFLARHPEVTIELTLNDRFTDPVEEGFDVALRITASPPDSSLASRQIARLKRILCAAPVYVQRCGEPATPQDLHRHNCIVYTRGESPEEWHFTGAEGKSVTRVKGNYRCNNSIVLREALLEGSGIGLLPAFIVNADIAASRLLPLMSSHTPAPRLLFAVFQHQRYPLPKVKMFVDFVEQSFAADSQLRFGE
ncbi:MAG: LysR family transcriptional regulator [Burkholderiales bacterium]|nr:LysR family transcriptional regulator [Burkholderiales bacterium]